MSLITLVCDGCGAELPIRARRTHDARKTAAAWSWTRKRGRDKRVIEDYCSQCSGWEIVELRV